jgi:mRNA interferase HigB
VEGAQWKTPQDIKAAHPKASILKGGRVVFNIKANDYRLIVVVHSLNRPLAMDSAFMHWTKDGSDAYNITYSKDGVQ